MIKVEIDKHSGFCFGVKKAIDAANQLLKSGDNVHCVGDIVHNEAESKRLNHLGMHIVNYDEVNQIKNGIILFRAHGEPPESYRLIKESGLELKDATCPVVLKLQQRVRKAFEQSLKNNGQLVIFGKRGHAEVIGLEGQCENKAIVIESLDEIHLLDLNRPIELFAQTTKDPEYLKALVEEIERQKGDSITWHNTTCKQVTGRVPRIKDFAKNYDLVVFVGGNKSSNAKVLFSACQDANSHSYFISKLDEFDANWIKNGTKSIGICGATSTPDWQMEQVKEKILHFIVK